jgi:hypothetical protein
VKKKITVDLNEDNSIKNAIKELKRYRKRVEDRTRKLVQRLTGEGAEIARVKIVNLGAYYSGELLSGVDGYYSPSLNAGFVRVTSDHVAFVEFGTGVKGQNSPHKNGEYLSKAAWSYATGAKIFTTQDGRVGWIYPTDDGGFRFTEGMPSRPFMYETAIQLQTDFRRIAKEVFST